MVDLSPDNLNELWISGQVIAVTFYEDHNKLVFTLKNQAGKFYVEICPVTTLSAVTRGDHVMVHGSLFSLRSGHYDTAKIRANLIQPLNTCG